MRIIGNIIWLIFGGLESAVGYFIGSFVLALTIVGIPFAYQTFKIGLLTLWPFGHEVVTIEEKQGCLTVVMNIIWILVGGIWISLVHVIFWDLISHHNYRTAFCSSAFQVSLAGSFTFWKRY